MERKKRIEKYYQLPRGVGLEELSDAEAGAIFKALDRYTGDSRETMPTAAMRLIYKVCCDHIDAENERYIEFCDKQAERIKKRWEKQNTIPRNTAEYQRIPYNHNQNQKQNIETESESESETETESKAAYAANNNSGSSSEREAFLRSLIENEQWTSDASTLCRIPVEDVKTEIERFIMHLRTTGDDNYNDMMGRAMAWLRSGKRQKEQNNGDTNDDYIRQRLSEFGL